MNVDSNTPTPYSESERRTLLEEINNMKNLRGIIPETHLFSTSTTSMMEYPNETDLQMEEMTPKEMTLEEMIPEEMIPKGNQVATSDVPARLGLKAAG
jgi:hypothetical protein